MRQLTLTVEVTFSIPEDLTDVDSSTISLPTNEVSLCDLKGQPITDAEMVAYETIKVTE